MHNSRWPVVVADCRTAGVVVTDTATARTPPPPPARLQQGLRAPARVLGPYLGSGLRPHAAPRGAGSRFQIRLSARRNSAVLLGLTPKPNCQFPKPQAVSACTKSQHCFCACCRAGRPTHGWQPSHLFARFFFVDTPRSSQYIAHLG
jgi:hypothetical protein